MLNRNRKISGRIAMAATGLLFGWMIAAMALSGSFQVEQFYKSGEIYDIDFEGRMADFPGIRYDTAVGGYQITDDTAILQYVLRGEFAAWKYLYLNIANLESEQIMVTAKFYMDSVHTGDRNIILSQGMNEVSLSGKPFNSLELILSNQKGMFFTIQKMQFRERQSCLTVQKFLAVQLTAALVFWLAANLILKKWCRKYKISWYMLIEGLQSFWTAVGCAVGELFYDMPKRTRRKIRVSVIFLLIMFMSVMENLVYLHSKPYYGISMLLCCIAVCILGFVSLEGKLIRKNWKNPLVASWTALWLISLISDVFVDKRYQYQGFIMLFAVGFFFFVWNNMKDRSVMLQDIMWGGEAAFWGTTLFIYICRPQAEEFRFLGFFRNPNIEAAFGAAAFILFLIELDNRILKKKNGIYGIICVIGLIIAFDRTYRSGGRTGIMAVAVSFAVFILHNIWYCRKNKTLCSFARTILICIILCIPVLSADNWIFNHLPQKLGTQVTYPKDLDYTGYVDWNTPDAVYAADYQDEQKMKETETGAQRISGRRSLSALLSSGTFSNAIEAYSSGRTLYYIAYIRQMNLLGHYYHAKNWGDYIYPHNGLLEIMYRYGIFAGIPYMFMLFYSFWYAFLYARRSKASHPYKLYPLAVSVGMYCILILENGEKPFVWMIWIIFYIGMGSLFDGVDNVREDALLEK